MDSSTGVSYLQLESDSAEKLGSESENRFSVRCRNSS